MRVADQRLQTVRPARQRELEKADTDEAMLRELMKKLAQAFATLEPSQQRAAEQEIAAARDEINVSRNTARTELEAVLKEADAARREIRAAREQYHALRRELDQLLPHLAADFADGDRLARIAETYFPAGQIQALAREIDDGEPHFGMLDQREQFAQLKIWIGRFRRLQAWAESGEGLDAGLTDEDHALLRETFPRLVGISKMHMPGYIEAFSRAFETDWDVYVAEATEALRLATEATRQAREKRQQAAAAQARGAEKDREAREAARDDLEKLKAIIARHRLPEEGVEEFNDTLEKVVKGFGQSDAQVLDLVRPYAELLNGSQFRALRRNLDREQQELAHDQENDALREELEDLLAVTRGQRVVLVGGDVREERRRQLEQVFEFGELEWVPYESARPAMQRSLEQRVRNHGMDVVLILKEFVGHSLSDSLRPLCEEQGIPCLYVDRGYGAAQVAEALRKGAARITPRSHNGDPDPVTNGQTDGQAG